MRIERAKPYRLREAASVLEMLDVTDGSVETVRSFDRCVEAPNVLADGGFVCNAGGLMIRLRPDGREERIDTAYLDMCNNDHVLSPDGRWIGVTHRTREDNLARVYLVPLEGGTPRLITPFAPSFLHGWSPDGKTLLYCGERDGNFDIYAIDAFGGVERRLTDDPAHDDGCEFSPDGRYIWFNSARTGRMQIWRMDRGGGGLWRPPQAERNNWFPHVSPDGSLVVYLSYGDDVDPSKHPPDREVQLRLMRSDGTGDRMLRVLFGGQGTINVNSWLPDGRRFAYVRYLRPWEK